MQLLAITIIITVHINSRILSIKYPFFKNRLVKFKSEIEKQEVKIMKVLIWRGDREIERVTGVYYQIGENCEDLLKLLDSGWTFDGTTEPDPESDQDADITLIHGKGILVPEPDNAVDSDAIAVYLIKILTRSRQPNA